jgi:hypothetical protein
MQPILVMTIAKSIVRHKSLGSMLGLCRLLDLLCHCICTTSQHKSAMINVVINVKWVHVCPAQACWIIMCLKSCVSIVRVFVLCRLAGFGSPMQPVVSSIKKHDL